jgi:hypothetical protein
MPTPANQFRLKLQPSFVYDFSIDWGDGSREIFRQTTPSLEIDAGLTHTYTSPGPKTISVTENVVGGFPKVMFNNFFNQDANNDAIKVKNIAQWGRGLWQALGRSYSNCINLVINATDHPTSTIGQTSNFNNAFYNCISLTNFPQLDTSNGTNFNSTWYNCSNITNFPLLNMNKMTNGINCFFNVKIPTETYTQLLINLAENNLNQNVVFYAGLQTFYLPSAQASRDLLTRSVALGGRNWTITDGGVVAGLTFNKAGGTQTQRNQFNFFTTPAGINCGVGCNGTSANFGPNELVTLNYNAVPTPSCGRPNVYYNTSRAVQYTYAAGGGISMVGNGRLNTGELIVLGTNSGLSIEGTASDGTPYEEGDGIFIQYQEIVINMSSAITVTANIRCS